MTGYLCLICGEQHGELPMSYGSPAPDFWFSVPEKQRERRTERTSDRCVIDEKFFFIAGNIEIPVIGEDETFCWTVWVSVAEKSFDRAIVIWDKEGRETEPPCFGWLNTTLPVYPETVHLKTHLHTRPVCQRPFVELEPTEHPLAVEQRNGITRQRIQEIAERLLHGEPTV